MIKTYKELVEDLKRSLFEEEDNYEGGHQKDWIVYNENLSRLFCIAILKEDKEWKIIEFVNIFASKKEILPMITMGYETMIKAAKDRDLYEYVIKTDHNFSKEDIDTDFWRIMIPSDKDFWSKKSLNAVIDKEEFELEMKRLVG